LPRYPIATYRVQFNKDFPFSKARTLFPFLQRIGISDLYASPVFRARPGSTHGYDVIDPSRVNPELGGDAEFEALAADLQQRGMGLVIDIVPNHMAASSHNAWWMDVLENGISSEYAAFFDVEWDPAWERGDEKIFLPVLGSPFGSALENAELQLAFDQGGFSINYYETRLPVDPGTYSAIFGTGPDEWPADPAFRDVMELIERLPERRSRVWEGIEARRRAIPEIKTKLWSLYQESTETRALIDRLVSEFNGAQGDAASFNRLESLIGAQGYRLAWWQVARERMNYRRFFDVSELIGMRVENPKAFAATHSAILRWINQGIVTGLRIDHVDGLFKPREYLERLSSIEPRPYIVVEKILLEEETLPSEWPIEGTSGYDFLGMVNGLFIDGTSFTRLHDTYQRFTGLDWTFEDAAYQQKRWIIRHLFRGEMFAMSLHLEMIAELDRHGRDLSPEELRKGLAEVTACLPVYRTYLEGIMMPERDRRYIEEAIHQARHRTPEVSAPAYDFLRRVLLCDFPPALDKEGCAAWVRFVMRWQQLTGPITAKGVEDTTMYVFNRFISMNEVGGQHSDVPPERFHQFNMERSRLWPAAMNTISTHDTKRSADVRARLNVLSEIPDEWNRVLFRWARWNRDKKTTIQGRAIPDGNEEILIYQTLLGAWPLREDEVPGFVDRVKQYLTKAAREAKVYSTWLKPDEEHEQALHRFAEAIMTLAPGNRFLPHFLEFQKKTAFFGALNSLSQTLLLITSPGIPDFYQNTTLWDLSLVDPDNRRPIELDTRLQIAEEIAGWSGSGMIGELLREWPDGRIKVLLIYCALHFRRAFPDLFIEGQYIPLQAEGKLRGNVVAFARKHGDEACITVVPRFVTRVAGVGRFPLGGKVWRDTRLVLPEELSGEWKNVITGAPLKSLALGDIFAEFPVALLAPR
jgi:(1->4)-alpha-D-glucan 1-alpha-D-glucosylmutase